MPNIDFQNGLIAGAVAGGINFKSVTLENDGTYTVIDTKDNTHTITPTTNSDGVITAIIYDNVNINLTYDNAGNLIKIGDSDVDVSDYVGVGIIPSGEIEITGNGEVDVTNYATATVNVAGGGYSGVAVIPVQNMAKAMPTNTTITI